MKIFDKAKEVTVLEDVKAGQTFRYDGEIYIATDTGNYLKLANGKVMVYYDFSSKEKTKVQIVECELIVK